MEKYSDEIKSVSVKLEVIISLLYDLKEALTNKYSIRDKVSYLSSKGMGNKEISRVLGISEKHVSKEKSLLNRTKQGEAQDGREEII